MARVFLLPTAAAGPVINVRHRGRLPKVVVSFATRAAERRLLAADRAGILSAIATCEEMLDNGKRRLAALDRGARIVSCSRIVRWVYLGMPEARFYFGCRGHMHVFRRPGYRSGSFVEDRLAS